MRGVGDLGDAHHILVTLSLTTRILVSVRFNVRSRISTCSVLSLFRLPGY